MQIAGPCKGCSKIASNEGKNRGIWGRRFDIEKRDMSYDHRERKIDREREILELRDRDDIPLFLEGKKKF